MPKKAAAKNLTEPTLQEQLAKLIDSTLSVAKTARKHGKSLTGVNFYANKIADHRADATNLFSRLADKSVGDTAALAEMMQKVFATGTDPNERAQAARDLLFALKTTWKDTPSPDQAELEEGGVFPLVTLNQTDRGYIVAIGRQMNGCYASGWYDGCAVMMRRLLEIAIIEAFEAKKIDHKIKDGKGDFLQLSDLVTAALAETAWNLSRGVKKALPALRDFGHKSAHGRHYFAKKMYIDELKTDYRDSLEAFLREAGRL